MRRVFCLYDSTNDGGAMNIGDLVKPRNGVGMRPQEGGSYKTWIGVIICVDEESGYPVVMWDEEFSDEVEYPHQLEVINLYNWN